MATFRFPERSMLPAIIDSVANASVGGLIITNHEDSRREPHLVTFQVPEIAGHDFSEVNNVVEDPPFFVSIGQEGMTAALSELNVKIQVMHRRNNLLSKKKPVKWIGREVPLGTIGLVNHGGFPKVLTSPGRYPRFPLRNWWARKWCGTQPLSNSLIQFKGLTIVQISQNQAAVVSDPQNRILVVKKSFVACPIKLGGTYNVLAIVDWTHLQSEVKDPTTGVLLGWTHDVKMRTSVGTANDQEYVAARFLNIPANNCAVLQHSDRFHQLPPGRHHITNSSIALRGLYTLGVNRAEMSTKDIFTKNQVPVELRIYLKWKLVKPLELITGGYSTPYDALRDKIQSILTKIAAHLSYSSMMTQSSPGSDKIDDGTHPATTFLDTLRDRAIPEVDKAASECGIDLKEFVIINRYFKGDIASKIDKLATKALQAQAESANIERENSNKVLQEEGALSAAHIKAKACNVQANAEAYNVIKAAEARAEAIRLTAKAEAEATRIKAVADADVVDKFARDMGMKRIEVSPNQTPTDNLKTIFTPSSGPGSQIGGAIVVSMIGNDSKK